MMEQLESCAARIAASASVGPLCVIEAGAVIDDGAGNILFNLAQQDMVALRVVMRLGWALPNPVNRVNPNAATRYPFAILEPTAPS